MTPAQRQAQSRKARREAGKVRIEAWVKAEHVQAIRAFIAKITKREDNE